MLKVEGDEQKENVRKKQKLGKKFLVDDNREEHFLRMVGGALNEDFRLLIINLPPGPSGQKRFTYRDRLLFQWSNVLFKFRNLCIPEIMEKYSNNDKLHEFIINNDSLCVVVAHYIAYLIRTNVENLVPRSMTRYQISVQNSSEDEIILTLMYALKKNDILREDLVTFLEERENLN